MTHTRSLASLACILTLACAQQAHAQKGQDAPPAWETGEAAPPAQSTPEPVEAPPPIDTETPPGADTQAGDGEAEGSPVDRRADLGLIVGGKVGGAISVGDFGATPTFELELGYAPDLGDSLGRALEIFLIGQYSMPGLDGASPPDARFPGGASFSYEIDQQLLTLALGGLFRFDVGSDLLMPYGGLGARLYLLQTESTASAAGEPFGKTTETQTDAGLVVLGGLEVFVGPGALLGELSFGWAGVDGYILRDTNLGALALAVGYRVML